jgi:hypothetical protein
MGTAFERLDASLHDWTSHGGGCAALPVHRDAEVEKAQGTDKILNFAVKELRRGQIAGGGISCRLVSRVWNVLARSPWPGRIDE